VTPRILVAGIGNIFLGDDAFGVFVAHELARRCWPADVQVAEFGIRGFDLAGTLLSGWDCALLIDALPRGAPPGTLHLLEPAVESIAAERGWDAHQLDPRHVLALATALGGPLPRVLIVGCEPAPLVDDDAPGAPLSAPVQAALPEAVALVTALVEALRQHDAAALPASLSALFEGGFEYDRDPHQSR
jgi:hydrogenase maturation protease